MPIKDKEQRNAYNREWYRRVGHQKAIDRAAKRKRVLVEKLRHYKSRQVCKICHEDHPACLDFHHRDPQTKEQVISNIIFIKGWKWERILEEIKKCDVLCSNCHRKLHYNQTLLV